LKIQLKTRQSKAKFSVLGMVVLGMVALGMVVIGLVQIPTKQERSQSYALPTSANTVHTV
jgi:Tfp pilus assembly protein PilN